MARSFFQSRGDNYGTGQERGNEDPALRLNGWVLYNIFCRGEEWVRVPQAEIDARAAQEGQ